MECINDIKSSSDFTYGLNDYLRKWGADGYVFPPDCSTTVIDLLHWIFGELDEDEWISYFCWELEFGKKYKSGTITCNGKEVSMSTPEELYDFLVSGLERM